MLRTKSVITQVRLAILPGVTHYNIFSSPTLVSAVTPFLDAPLKKALQQEQQRTAPFSHGSASSWSVHWLRFHYHSWAGGP
jgi:hypothetical protein